MLYKIKFQMVKKANIHASVMQTGGRTGRRTDLLSQSEFDWSRKLRNWKWGRGGRRKVREVKG